MSRPKKAPQPDLYEPCARCFGAYELGAIWPEGRVCQYCYRAAMRTNGTCATCGHKGVLPGLTADGLPTCRECSHISLNVDCRECGLEGEIYRAGRCWRCELRREAEALLTPPGSPERVELRALVEAIATMERPNSGVTWIRQTHVKPLLASLGRGEIPLSHDALDGLPKSRTIEHLRGLLVEHDALPPRDRYLTEFKQWSELRPAMVVDKSSRRVIEQYLRWHQMRRLQKGARTHGTVKLGLFLSVKQATTVAIGFLNYLSERDVALSELDQHTVDDWFGSGPSTRALVEDFLYWAQSHRHTPSVSIPRRVRYRSDELGQSGRLAILGKLLQDQGAPLGTRVAGGLVVLFAQPVVKTAAMKLDQIRALPGGELELLFAKDWVPVPDAFAVLLDRWIGARSNLQTAAHRNSPWLFPGRGPGSHLQAGALSQLLDAAGISARQAKAAAWRDLVQTVPPALLSRAFGITAQTAETYADLGGSRYSRYAALKAIGS